MADNSAISEVAQKGIQAAKTVRGAVKAGKSIATAAKGASAGGWIGAVAAFAWENRRLVAAITVGIVVILLLPVVIVTMLPSLIFGGTGNAYSPADTNNPILNNATVITENIEKINLAVETVLNEGLQYTLNEIEQDKTTLPEESNVEIVMPLDDEISYNKTLIISQYSASKSQDYNNISISDFEYILKQHIDKISYYEKTEEIRQIESSVTVVDANTGKETENIIIIEKKFTVYTVFINREEYFADNIFNLSAQQKELADNYAESLNLYLNGGI